ncbi:formylglycine-generating enzyme family protein, partial [Myxococcota bacterium]
AGGDDADGGSSAANATCSPKAKPGDLQCADTVVQICSSDGQWQDQETCADDTPRCSGGKCLCKPDAKRCHGGTAQACTADGTWQVVSKCSGDTPACLDGNCVACIPGAGQCDGDIPLTCTQTGDWKAQPECPAGCTEGLCRVPPSCQDELQCLDNDKQVSCCTSKVIPGGEFPMGRSTETCDGCSEGCPPDMICPDWEQPEHPMQVSDFRLDKYEVTVGRFREYVEAYDWNQLVAMLEAGGGTHPGVEGSGWDPEWNTQLPYAQEDLIIQLTSSKSCTWTSEVGRNEQLPITCVPWYEAFAFCAWDQGRLPTETEWEYAATGGSENRLFPWGAELATASHANYGEGDRAITAVGSLPRGNGRWGHSDLGGNMAEWVLDYIVPVNYEDWPPGCLDCANVSGLTMHGDRVLRGGHWLESTMTTDTEPSMFQLRATARYWGAPRDRSTIGGIRCARTP